MDLISANPWVRTKFVASMSEYYSITMSKGQQNSSLSTTLSPQTEQSSKAAIGTRGILTWHTNVQQLIVYYSFGVSLCAIPMKYNVTGTATIYGQVTRRTSPGRLPHHREHLPPHYMCICKFTFFLGNRAGLQITFKKTTRVKIKSLTTALLR